MPLIFVSHAAADAALANRITSLVRVGCSLRANEVFCTSAEGAGVRTGEQFTAWIRDHLRESRLFLMVVTPSYFASRFCVAEMGAAWALGIPVFALVVPSMKRDLGGPLLGTHTEELGGIGLDHLSERIEEFLPEAKTPRAMWNVERNAFLEDLPRLLEKLPQPDVASRAEVEEARAEAEAALTRYREVREHLAEAEERIAALEAVKDAAEVAAVRRKFSTDAEQYTALREAARDEVRSLDRPTQRALFATLRGEGWEPSGDLWTFYRADMDRAINAQTIVEGRGEDGGYVANPDHPVVEDALAALAALRDFLDEASEETRSTIRREHRVIPDVRNGDFWRSELLQGVSLWE